MNTKIKFVIAAAIILAVFATSSAYGATPEKKVLRLGYFPNLTHETAVIGAGNGDYAKALAKDNIELKTMTFNAGPSAIEALFANRVDATYIGPNPAINGYTVSEGKGLKIVAGASSGGAVFVVRNDAGINSVKDFAGKKFSSPQLGNTQDVALRLYLLEHGYKTKENGGNVEVLPAKNPDIVTLMINKKIDGAWVPEPWGAKLIKEANGKIFLDERDLWPEGKFVTTHLIVRSDYLKNNPDVIKRLLEAHVEETIWIQKNPEEAKKAFNAEFKKLTGKLMPEDELNDASTRFEITYDPIQSSLFKSADAAFKVGLLGDKAPELSGIYDLALLNQVLAEKGLTKKDTKQEKQSVTKSDTNTKAKEAKPIDTKKTEKKTVEKKTSDKKTTEKKTEKKTTDKTVKKTTQKTDEKKKTVKPITAK
jgi:NitT/TauT family transport system substrate-binding protein